MYHQASKRKIPIVMFEDGFLRSIFPAGFHEIDKMVFGHSIILDGRGLYINAYTESEMEAAAADDSRVRLYGRLTGNCPAFAK